MVCDIIIGWSDIFGYDRCSYVVKNVNVYILSLDIIIPVVFIW